MDRVTFLMSFVVSYVLYSTFARGTQVMMLPTGDGSSKTSYQSWQTGPVAITETSPDGSFIGLENRSAGQNRRDVNIDGWKLKQSVDGKRDYMYHIKNFTLKAGKKVKIFARGSAPKARLGDIVFRDEDTWGIGSQVTTSLLNNRNEEVAAHVKKTLK